MQESAVPEQEPRFLFQSTTYGLPDSELLGQNGRPQEGVLRQVLDLNRDQGRRFAKKMRGNPKKLETKIFNPRHTFLNVLSDPVFRASLAETTFSDLRIRAMGEKVSGGSASTNGSIRRKDHYSLYCWELLVMYRYAPDVWETAFPEDEIDREVELFGEYSDLERAFEAIVDATSVRVEQNMLSWEKLPEVKRVQLANVIFALGMVSDPVYIMDFFSEHPDLAGYYSIILSNEYNKKLSDSFRAWKNEQDEGPEGGTEPQCKETSSPEELTQDQLDPIDVYQKIEALAQGAQLNPMDTSAAPAILDLAQKLNTWLEKHPQTKPIEECVAAFVAAMYGMGNEAGVEGFAKLDPTSPFEAIWLHYFASKSNIAADVLIKRLSSSQEEVDRLGPLADHLRSEIKDFDDAYHALSEQKPENRIARRELEEKLEEINVQRSQRRGRRDEAEDQGILALLPAGASIDDFDDQERESTSTIEDISTEMGTALQRVGAYLESGFIASVSPEDDEEIELASNEIYAKGWKEAFSESAPETGSDVDVGLTMEDAEHQAVEPEPEPEPEPESESASSEDSEDIPEDTIVKDDTDSSSEKSEARAQEEQPEADQGLQLSDLERDCLRQINENGVINSDVANYAIIALIKGDRLEEAHQLSVLLDQKQFATNVIPALLLRAACYGRTNWGFGRNLTKTQKLVNTIFPGQIDQWVDCRDSGKAVPYLVLTACFQASVFGGLHSNAPVLLSSIAHHFDGALARLIEDTVALANRAQPVRVADLRDEGDEEDHSNYVQLVRNWKQRLEETKVGYAPILKAQSVSLEKGEFSQIVRIIETNAVNQVEVVRNFCATYVDQRVCENLLNQSLRAAGHEVVVGKVTPRATARFHSKVNELIDIAQGWITKTGAKNSEVAEYCRRFRTSVPNVIGQLEAIASDTSQADERLAGICVALSMFKNINLVIEGSSRPMWSYGRAKAWLRYPMLIAPLQGRGNGALEQLSWHLRQIEYPVSHAAMLSVALEEKHTALGYLMYLFLRDHGEDRARVAAVLDEQISAHRLALLRRCAKLESQIDNMLLSLLIDADRAEVLMVDIADLREGIESLEHYTPSRDIVHQLDAIREEIDSKTANKLNELKSRYQSELEAIRASMSFEPVPSEWIETMEDAISDANLPVIDEMLDELQKARRDNQQIKAPTVTRSTILAEFREHDERLHTDLKKFSDGKAIWQEISASKDSCFGLNFERQNSSLKKVIEAISSWNWAQLPRQMGNDFAPFYDKVRSVLDFLGLELADTAFRKSRKEAIDYQVDNRFAALYVKIKPTATDRPFPIFGASDSQPIIIAHNEWSPAQLEAFMSSIRMVGKKPIMISGVPMTRGQREEFAHYFKVSKSTILHLDIVMALFLASRGRTPAENSDIRKFLWLTIPWTYFNPYVGGDTTYPPPREMRFGRLTEINGLLEMNNGRAIVFGGRQLGKSTIVQEVRYNFNKPSQKQHAFYSLLDKNVDRMRLDHEGWETARRKVWRTIHEGLVSRGLIQQPKSELTSDEMASEVETALRDNKEDKFIFIFDEIDPILNVDNAHGFGIFRGIRELVSQPDIQGRFKVIIAGLENVKRFERSPNNPLQQLGGSLQVSIMSTQDALHLIEEPLLAAGYAFENAQVANRILSVTNRHPGLIQIFCHQLISYLAGSSNNSVGEQFIQDSDVTAVSQNQDVIDLIRQRFDMTLVLDRRYGVIVYGLLLERKGTRPFSTKDAHDIARQWLPEEFDKLSQKQFEAFLEELCGLGVLKALPGGGFSIRSTNIQKLIGTDEDIADALQLAITQKLAMSPLDRHAVWPDDSLSCPITFRDEQDLLGDTVTADDDSEVRQLDSWKYTTSIIVGSNALGLNALEKTLPRLYEAERENHMELKRAAKYELHARHDADFATPEKFRSNLLGVVSVQSKKAPQMVIVTVSGNKPIAHLLAMISASHDLNGIEMEKRFPVRVIFALSPIAYWQWLSHPELTRGTESLQPFINLSTWGVSGVAHMLEKFGMVYDPKSIDRFIEHTEGWHMAIDGFGDIKRKNRKVKDISDIADKFPAITKFGGKKFKQFRDGSGIDDLPWVRDFIAGCCDTWESTDFAEDELREFYSDSDLANEDGSDFKSVISWLTAMNILKMTREDSDSQASYRVSPSILHVLNSDEQ